MSHIFISYSHDDRWSMRLVAAYLRNERFEVWADERLDTTGSGWRKELDKHLRSASCVVVLLSPSAIESNWVAEEIDTATTQKIPIIPALIEGEEVPFGLRRLQRFDLRNDYMHVLQGISSVVSKYAERVPLETQGIDWKKVGSVYWIASDSRLLRSMLVPPTFSAKKFYKQILQVYHHAKRINFAPLDLKRLETLVEIAKGYKDVEWTPEERTEVEAEIRSMFRGLADKAQQIDEDFDPGPKWAEPPSD